MGKMPSIRTEAITAEEMAKIDQKAVELGIPRVLLMENAGNAVAGFITEKFGTRLKLDIFAGTGNNGGDGFVAARHLANAGGRVKVFLVGKPEDIRTEEAGLNWGVIKKMKQSIKIHEVKTPSDLRWIWRHLKIADVIIDAMLGTGLKGQLREPYASIVKLINQSHIPVVSVDAPTGLNPSTGEIHGVSVQATYTVTFHRMKRGFSKKRKYTGKVVVADIGIPKEAGS